jgi:hypothetical protein
MDIESGSSAVDYDELAQVEHLTGMLLQLYLFLPSVYMRT